MRFFLSSAILVSLIASTLEAQSALSTQGFGYPTGGISTRALSTGGGAAEVDPVSALNPASLIRWETAGLAAQLAPESRVVRGPSEEGSTRVVRFPLYSAGIPINRRLTLGVSSSTLLDQSWATKATSTQIVGGQSVQSTRIRSTTGAMNDIRLAAGYSVLPSLAVGVGFHLIAGSNVVAIATDYVASDISDISQRTEISYSGSAFSAGLLWDPVSSLSIGLSARKGGSMAVKRLSEELGSGNVPGRAGVSVAFSGYEGALVVLRYERVSFSDMNGLGSENATARDTHDFGGGVEFNGPQMVGNRSILRVGYRQRGLPFDAIGAKVMESSYSAGFGLALSQRRAMLDLGVVRVFRDNNSSFRESAWILAAGIIVRP